VGGARIVSVWGMKNATAQGAGNDSHEFRGRSEVHQ
jgi:hypothetical protein